VLIRINWSVFYDGTGRIVAQVIIVFPVVGGPDWPGDEPSPTVWADVFQNSLHTASAEGALIGTDARFNGIGRKWLVAIFTGWSKF
jgi:hypothetical protein